MTSQSRWRFILTETEILDEFSFPPLFLPIPSLRSSQSILFTIMAFHIAFHLIKMKKLIFTTKEIISSCTWNQLFLPCTCMLSIPSLLVQKWLVFLSFTTNWSELVTWFHLTPRGSWSTIMCSRGRGQKYLMNSTNDSYNLYVVNSG